MDLTTWFETLASVPAVWAAIAVAFGAGVEYVLPPVPGDSIVFAGALLAVSGGTSPWWMVLAATVGAVTGAAIAIRIGWWLTTTGRYATMPRRRRAAIDAVLARFEAHGSLWLVINRFLPGIRGLVFVAAGVARIDVRRALGFGALGAVVYSLVLVGIATWAGGAIEEADGLLGIVAAVGAIAAIVIAIGIVRTALAGARSVDAKPAADPAADAGEKSDETPPVDG